MNLSDKSYIELIELLDRLVENNLSYDQKKRLESLLSDSEEARRIYVSYLDMSVSLGYYADECLACEEKDENNKGLSNLIDFVQPLIPVAALLLLGLYLFFTLPEKTFWSSKKTQPIAQTLNHNTPATIDLDHSAKPVVAILT